MASYFEDAVRNLYDMGVLDILLPFILIFTLIFAVLQRTKVLGKNKDTGEPMKNFNAIIAIVMASATVIPHVLWGSRSSQDPYLSNGTLDVVQVINNALPNVSLVVVAILMFLIIVGIWGKRIDIGEGNLGGIVALFSVAAIGLIFAIASGWNGWLPNWLRFLEDPQTQALVVVILVFGLIIRFITGDDHKKDKKESWMEKMSKSMKDVD
jgi:hypothetical protein